VARKLRIRVDHDVCVGNAMCETIAPKVFRLNDNRQSEVVDPAGDTVEKPPSLSAGPLPLPRCRRGALRRT
jgi:ferredoxin